MRVQLSALSTGVKLKTSQAIESLIGRVKSKIQVDVVYSAAWIEFIAGREGKGDKQLATVIYFKR